MEEVYLTVKELADIKGCTERYVRRLIEKQILHATEISNLATGQGGIQYRIPLSALDSRLQMKFKRRLKRLEKLKKQQNQEALPDSEQEPEELPAPACSYEAFSDSEREEILYWKKLLQEWQAYRGSFSGNKAEADESFLSVVNLQHRASHKLVRGKPEPDKPLTLGAFFQVI